MNVEELVKKVQNERKSLNEEVFSNEGLARLQETMENYSGEYELVWSDALLEELKKRPKKKLHQTKIEALDSLIGGFKEQQLITIGAHTKHGKTAMGIFLMEQLEELSPVMIPLEQSNEEIVEQRSENGYSIPKFLSPKNLAAQVTTEWIEERVVEGIAKHNTKLVLIDHLGYVNNFGKDGAYKRENLAYRIGQIMRELKNIAKRWNVVILLLVQLSQHNESHPPSMNDIKNSSDISQESDMIIFLWRENEHSGKVHIHKNRTLVSVMANRRTGKNGNIGLLFDSETGRYKEDESTNSWVDSMVKLAEQDINANEVMQNLE